MIVARPEAPLAPKPSDEYEFIIQGSNFQPTVTQRSSMAVDKPDIQLTLAIYLGIYPEPAFQTSRYSSGNVLLIPLADARANANADIEPRDR